MRYERPKTLEEWLSLSVNELNDSLLELTSTGLEFVPLLKLRSNLIKALFWTDRYLSKLYLQRKDAEGPKHGGRGVKNAVST